MTANGQQNAPSGTRTACARVVVRDKGTHRLLWDYSGSEYSQFDNVVLEVRDGGYWGRQDFIYRGTDDNRTFWRNVARRWNIAVAEKPPVTGLQLEAIALGGERLSLRGGNV